MRQIAAKMFANCVVHWRTVIIILHLKRLKMYVFYVFHIYWFYNSGRSQIDCKNEETKRFSFGLIFEYSHPTVGWLYCKDRLRPQTQQKNTINSSKVLVLNTIFRINNVYLSKISRIFHSDTVTRYCNCTFLLIYKKGSNISDWSCPNKIIRSQYT